MSVLVVVSHPDDEVLGIGGTSYALSQQGVTVNACILSGSVSQRAGRPDSATLEDDARQAMERVGIFDFELGNFENIQFNSTPHIDLVKFIETSIVKYRPSYIFTHHPSDLNNDHLHTALACLAAARLFQRRPGVPELRGLYAMEILSSTDWAFPANTSQFLPTAFFEIGEAGLKAKTQALAAYRGVMRDYPHPRSTEAIRALATSRGAQSGKHYAEAFQVLYSDLNIQNGW